MDVRKKIKYVGTKPGDKGSNMWYIKTTDEEFYSTWNLQVGKGIEELDLKEGDIVKLQFETNKKGYKNITAIEKEIDVLADAPEEKVTGLARTSEGLTLGPTFQQEKTADIHRQVAWKVAGQAWGWLDLEGKTEKERMKLLSGLAQTIEKILNE